MLGAGLKRGVLFLSRNICTDASYSDPLQGLPERPKTAARRANPADDDGFGDDDLDDTLLPE